MKNNERSLGRLPSTYIVTSLVIAAIVLAFVKHDGNISEDTEAVQAAQSIKDIPAGSKVLVLVDYGPEGRYELESGLASLITVLAKKDIGVVFASLIVQGIESTSFAVEKSITKVNFRKEGYYYGKDYIQMGFFAGGSIAAAMMTGDVDSYRDTDIFGNRLRDLPVMNGVFSLDDFSAVIEFSSTKVEGVPGIVFYTVFNRKKDLPVIAVCTSDMVSDYLPFSDSGSISHLVKGMKGIVSFEHELTQESGAKRRFLISAGILWLVLLIIAAGNISNLLRGRK